MEVIKAKTDMSEDQQFDFYENMFNALADKIRLKILNQISQSFNKSLCVCDLEELLDIKQSKLSYHLKISRCKCSYLKSMAHGIITKLMNNKYRLF